MSSGPIPIVGMVALSPMALYRGEKPDEPVIVLLCMKILSARQVFTSDWLQLCNYLEVGQSRLRASHVPRPC